LSDAKINIFLLGAENIFNKKEQTNNNLPFVSYSRDKGDFFPQPTEKKVLLFFINLR